MGTTFKQEQYQEAYPQGIGAHWWQRSRLAALTRSLRAGDGDAGLIVDIGCGRGLEVLALRQQGFDCIGVEEAPVRPTPGAAPFIWASTRAAGLPHDIRIRCRTILLLDVLEHLDRPDDFLASLRPLYPNAAVLILTVPARQELWSNYDEHYGHRRRYALSDSKAIAEAAGGSVRTASYLFHFLYPAAWLMTKRKAGRAVTIDAPRGALRLLHRAIGWFFLLEASLLPSRLPGTSLLISIDLER